MAATNHLKEVRELYEKVRNELYTKALALERHYRQINDVANMLDERITDESQLLEVNEYKKVRQREYDSVLCILYLLDAEDINATLTYIARKFTHHKLVMTYNNAIRSLNTMNNYEEYLQRLLRTLEASFHMENITRMVILKLFMFNYDKLLSSHKEFCSKHECSDIPKQPIYEDKEKALKLKRNDLYDRIMKAKTDEDELKYTLELSIVTEQLAKLGVRLAYTPESMLKDKEENPGAWGTTSSEEDDIVEQICDVETKLSKASMVANRTIIKNELLALQKQLSEAAERNP